MTGIIVYFSTYGSTQKYAESLAERMGWKALNVKRVTIPDIKSAETVVLASNIRIGKMGIRKWAKRHRDMLKKKKLHVLAVGGDTADNQKYYRETAMKNLGFLDLKVEQISGLGGRKIRSELNRKDTFLFNSLDKIVKDPAAKEDILKDVDLVDPGLLEAVVKQLCYKK